MEQQDFLGDLLPLLKAIYFKDQNKVQIADEFELMSYFLHNAEIRKLLSTWLKKCYSKKEVKSLVKAKAFRNKGNIEFQGKNYSSSIQKYTKSAQYAPLHSEDLAIAIANRSASLFYLGKYKECIKDIEVALKLEYPEKGRYKLYQRAIKCYMKLGKKDLTKNTLLQLRETMDKCSHMLDTKKEEIEKQFEQLRALAACMQNDTNVNTNETISCLRPKLSFGPHQEFPSASASLDRKYTPDKGRYVIANRNIKKGETLFVEEPFAFVLLDHNRSNNLCVHCGRFYGEVPFPCATCLDTLYCDIECQNNAWSYHRWECPGNQMGLWPLVGIAHLAVKVLLVCITTSDRIAFNEVQKLVTNFYKLPVADLLTYGACATVLTLYFYEYTDFFKVNDLGECLASKFFDDDTKINCDITTEADKQVYISCLLLRHVLQLVSNGHAITNVNAVLPDENQVYTVQQDRIATAIYLTASIMNHSCDPNINYSFMDQYLIVKSTKYIKAGEEVFNCYGPHFRRMSKEQRQEILKHQYCFICKCDPCTKPEFEYFMERFSAIKCPKCSGAIHAVNSNSLQCLDCGAMPAINYQNELKQAENCFDTAQVYIQAKMEEKALAELRQCLNIRRTILYKYHNDISITLDSIGQVYAMMGQWLDSISYVEQSIVAIEERFGSYSVEIAHELNKLTDIYVKYLLVGPNRPTKWNKDAFKKAQQHLNRAEEIMELHYGPWNDACNQITKKKGILCELSKNFSIYR